VLIIDLHLLLLMWCVLYVVIICVLAETQLLPQHTQRHQTISILLLSELGVQLYTVYTWLIITWLLFSVDNTQGVPDWLIVNCKGGREGGCKEQEAGENLRFLSLVFYTQTKFSDHLNIVCA